MIPPQRPGKNVVLLPWLLDVWNFIRAIQPRVGPGLILAETSSGTIISLAPVKRGAGETALDPWQPIFTSTTAAEVTTYKCRFNLGTVNNVAATNWNAEHTLTMAADVFHFVVLTVTAASGKVTGLTISIDTTPPETDETAQDVPPTEWKILLGAIGRAEAKMIIRKNLQAVAGEVFRESKAAPAVGAEPFHRWWRWTLSLL